MEDAESWQQEPSEDEGSHTRAVGEALTRFADPTDPLEIANVEAHLGSERRIKCQICGWPDTSKKPDVPPGLTWVFHLANRRTGQQLLIGRECAACSESVLRKKNPQAVIAGLPEALERVDQTRAARVGVGHALAALWQRHAEGAFPQEPPQDRWERLAWLTFVSGALPPPIPERRFKVREEIPRELEGTLLTRDYLSKMLWGIRKQVLGAHPGVRESRPRQKADE